MLEEFYKMARNVKSHEQHEDLVEKLESIEINCNTAPELAAIKCVSLMNAEISENVGVGYASSYAARKFLLEYESSGLRDTGIGIRVMDYDRLLFPQYEAHFDKVISKQTWERIQGLAKEELDGDLTFVADKVIQHWKDIVDGKPPFGFIVKKYVGSDSDVLQGHFTLSKRNDQATE